MVKPKLITKQAIKQGETLLRMYEGEKDYWFFHPWGYPIRMFLPLFFPCSSLG